VTLHERLAKALGWTVEQAQELSLRSLRELVRPVDLALADVITEVLQDGEFVIVKVDSPLRFYPDLRFYPKGLA
jgi:hypothetical protein